MFENYYLRRKTKISFGRLVKPAGLIAIFSVTSILLLISQMILANKLATDGENIKRMEIATQKTLEENSFLENKLLHLGSLNQINERAKTLGLIKVDKIDVITAVPYAFVP